MNVEYNCKTGKLEIEVCDLLREMQNEKIIELIDVLSCEDAIIRHVSDQILTGWTELMSHGGESFTAQSNDAFETPLSIARRRIAISSSEIAEKEIERLKATIKRYEEADEKRRQEEQHLRDLRY